MPLGGGRKCPETENADSRRTLVGGDGKAVTPAGRTGQRGPWLGPGAEPPPRPACPLPWALPEVAPSHHRPRRMGGRSHGAVGPAGKGRQLCLEHGLCPGEQRPTSGTPSLMQGLWVQHHGADTAPHLTLGSSNEPRASWGRWGRRSWPPCLGLCVSSADQPTPRFCPLSAPCLLGGEDPQAGPRSGVSSSVNSFLS